MSEKLPNPLDRWTETPHDKWRREMDNPYGRTREELEIEDHNRRVLDEDRAERADDISEEDDLPRCTTEEDVAGMMAEVEDMYSHKEEGIEHILHAIREVGTPDELPISDEKKDLLRRLNKQFNIT